LPVGIQVAKHRCKIIPGSPRSVSDQSKIDVIRSPSSRMFLGRKSPWMMATVPGAGHVASGAPVPFTGSPRDALGPKLRPTHDSLLKMMLRPKQLPIDALLPTERTNGQVVDGRQH